MPHVARIGATTLLLLLPAGACREAPAGWDPVLEETSVTFLETELSRDVERVSTARRALASDAGEEAVLLEEAERGLKALHDVYVPLLRARALAYNAYRFHHLGRDADARTALDGVRAEMEGIGEAAPEGILTGLERVEELAVDAGVEMEAGRDRGSAALLRLADELAGLVSRADMFL